MKQRPQQICHVITFTNLALSRSMQASAEGMDIAFKIQYEDAGVIAIYVSEQDVTLKRYKEQDYLLYQGPVPAGLCIYANSPDWAQTLQWLCQSLTACSQ